MDLINVAPLAYLIQFIGPNDAREISLFFSQSIVVTSAVVKQLEKHQLSLSLLNFRLIRPTKEFHLK
jgi:hypothetical protein